MATLTQVKVVKTKLDYSASKTAATDESQTNGWHGHEIKNLQFIKLLETKK